MFKVLLSKVVEVLCEKCLTKSLTYNNNSIEINFPCCNIQNFANGSNCFSTAGLLNRKYYKSCLPCHRACFLLSRTPSFIVCIYLCLDFYLNE